MKSSWVFGLLAVSLLLLLYSVYTVVSSFYGSPVAFGVTVVIVATLYYLYVSGRLDSLISFTRSNPSSVFPVAVGAVVAGAYLAFFVKPALFVDLYITVSYKLKPGEGLGGSLFGAVVDANSIQYRASVISAYYERPYFVAFKSDPPCRSFPDPRATVLELYVPETQFRCYMEFRNANVFSRYLGGGASDYFSVRGLLLDPNRSEHPIVFTVISGGDRVWTATFIVKT